MDETVSVRELIWKKFQAIERLLHIKTSKEVWANKIVTRFTEKNLWKKKTKSSGVLPHDNEREKSNGIELGQVFTYGKE